MSFKKAIFYGKERRKQYYDSRKFDKSCRNHGSCLWCLDNRTAKNNIKTKWAKQEIYENK